MSEKGQTLIEVIISVGIITLVLISVAELITRSNKVVRLQKQRDDALAFATTTIASYRAEKDRNPSAYFDPGNLKTTEDCGSETFNQTLYSCDADFNYADANSFTLTVTITWSDQAINDSNVQVSSVLTRPVI